MPIINAILFLLILSSCTTQPNAPVIDRTPASTSSAPPSSQNNADKDWRPDHYIVKKADTLFSIGLEFGYDYKEIAAANGISPPYIIKVGQVLKLASLKPKNISKSNPSKSKDLQSSSSKDDTDEVVVSPIKTESSPTANNTSTNRSSAPIETSSAQTKSSEQTKTAPIEVLQKSPATNDEDIIWVWPTAGKVIKSFADSGNKGIDIAGIQGQAILAAASGKVIYSGADLRGYGKLVIIKHNSNYLSVYAHNHQILVKEGQQIQKSQKIAEMGNTDAEQTKLHFEIRKQGKSVDPSGLLSKN